MKTKKRGHKIDHHIPPNLIRMPSMDTAASLEITRQYQSQINIEKLNDEVFRNPGNKGPA